MEITSGKVVKVLDFLKEKQQEIESNPDYKIILDEAKLKLQRDLAEGKSWMEVKKVPLKHCWFNYQVQRAFNIGRAVRKIIEPFDPRIVTLPIAIRVNDERYEITDGMHGPTASKCLLLELGEEDEILCLVVNTSDPAFPGKIFRVLNHSGTAKAEKYDILKIEYRDYVMALDKLKNEPNDIAARNVINDPDYINAYQLVELFKKVNVDLIPERSKQSSKLRKNYWYCSHIQYARDLLYDVGPDIAEEIMTAYTKLFCTENSEPKVDNGMFSGMAALYLSAIKENLVKTYPKDWVEQVYQVLKDNLGDSPKYIHNTCIKAQAEHWTDSWNCEKHFPAAVREIFVKCASVEQLKAIRLPYDEKTCKILRIQGENAQLIESFKFKSPIKNVA